MRSLSELPPLHHCSIHEIAPGVYVARPLAGGGAASNAGIVALGDHTLIFDTFLTPVAALELRQAAELLTEAPIKVVVNSHHHLDHVGGNQVFAAGADLVATIRTRQLLESQTTATLAQRQTQASALLTQLADKVTGSKGATRQSAEAALGQQRVLMGELPTMTIRLPNVTFTDRLILHGTARQAEVITFGGGHTQSDTILYLPAEQVVFMGDLLSIKCHPFLADGDPGELPRILDAVQRLAPTQVVPGHGEVGSPAELQQMQSYLAVVTEGALTELAFQFEDETELAHKIARFPMPRLFAGWERAEHFPANLRFLYQRVMAAYAE